MLDLTNHFLIAMPDLDDSLFSGSLIYVCEHTAEGAMGLMVNKPSPIEMEIILAGAGGKMIPPRFMHEFVMMGGPVQPDRGFVLHTPLGTWQSSLKVNEINGITTSRDIIQALVNDDEGVEKAVLAIGYCQWVGGQLEKELSENAWLSVEADNRILFDLPFDERYQAALHKLGVDEVNLMRGVAYA